MTEKIFPSAYAEFPCDNLSLLFLALSGTGRFVLSSVQESFRFLQAAAAAASTLSYQLSSPTSRRFFLPVMFSRSLTSFPGSSPTAPEGHVQTLLPSPAAASRCRGERQSRIQHLRSPPGYASRHRVCLFFAVSPLLCWDLLECQLLPPKMSYLLLAPHFLFIRWPCCAGMLPALGCAAWCPAPLSV